MSQRRFEQSKQDRIDRARRRQIEEEEREEKERQAQQPPAAQLATTSSPVGAQDDSHGRKPVDENDAESPAPSGRKKDPQLDNSTSSDLAPQTTNDTQPTPANEPTESASPQPQTPSITSESPLPPQSPQINFDETNPPTPSSIANCKSQIANPLPAPYTNPLESLNT